MRALHPPAPLAMRRPTCASRASAGTATATAFAPYATAFAPYATATTTLTALAASAALATIT